MVLGLLVLKFITHMMQIAFFIALGNWGSAEKMNSDSSQTVQHHGDQLSTHVSAFLKLNGHQSLLHMTQFYSIGEPLT